MFIMVKKTSSGKQRIVGMFPNSFIDELVSKNEVSVDTIGRVRGFTTFVRRMYRGGKL